MFRNNERKEVFGLRKYKGYGLTGALIGALMFGVSGTAHANVIENNDGTTTLENGKASITLESSHVKESDKSATELYKAGEYGTEKVKEGTDEVTVKKTVDVKYVTESGSEIDKSVSNDAEKKVSETYEVTGKSGKKYKGDDNVTIDVDQTSGKKDVITKDGKTYKYVRSEVEKTGDVSAKDAVTFNDVKTHATVQGMHKADGGINYDKITSRVWLVEEKEDGTYGKFKLIENGTGLTDEKVAELSKETTGTLSAAEVEKLGGMKDTDTILVYETNTYAAVKKEQHSVHDLVMTWGYSGGYSNAMGGGLGTDIPGVTKDGSGNYYYKGVRLINYLKDTDKMMSDSTELDVYKDILEGKDESLLKYIGNFGNAPEVYRDHLFSRWMLARNKELVKKIKNGDYRDAELSETIDGKPLNEITFSNLDGYKETESVHKTLGRMVDSLYTPENMQSLIRYLDNLQKASVLYWHDDKNVSDSLKELISEAKKTPTVTYWKKLIAALDDGTFHEPIFRSNVHEDSYLRASSDPEVLEMVDEFFNKQPGMKSMADDGTFVGEVQVFDVNETTDFWDKYPKVKAYINKHGKKVFNEKVRIFLISSVGEGGWSFDENSSSRVGSDQSGVVYRPYGKGILQKVENFSYHDTVAPLRAYRLNSENAVLKHVYKEVEKGSVVTNYYIENTTTKLADSVSQSDLDVGTKYQTRTVTPTPKIETEDLEDRTITRTTKYELVKTPDNASGDIIKGETVVNYYYRPVTTENVVMKQFKDIVTYHSETRYDVQHVFDAELEKDVKGFGGNNSIFLHQKYGTKTEVVRMVYDAILGFGDKKGAHPPLSKIREAEDNFAKMLGYESREDYLKNNKDVIFDLNERPLFQVNNTDVTIQSNLTTGFTDLVGDVVDFRTRGKFDDLDVYEKIDANVLNAYESRLPDGAELELTKITYNIDGGEEKVLPKTGFPFSRSNGTMQKSKTTHYTYHYKLKKRETVTNTENLKGSVVVKYVTIDGKEIKEAVTIQRNAPAGQRVTKSLMSGTADLGSKTEVVEGTTKYDANTVKEDRIEKDGKTYVLTRVLPKDKRFNNTENVDGVVKEGLTTIVYEYKEIEKAPVTVHYYKDGTTEELAPSVDKGQSDIGSKYTTEAKVIEPKVTVEETPEKTITRTVRYELKEVPRDKDGVVPVGGKVVTYYYVEKVDVKEVMKQAPVTVHYYKDGTTEKLADSIEKGKQDIGSKYVTEAKVIEPKVVVQDLPEKTVTTTTRYELKEVPKDKDGVVPVGGKVVTYYYVEKVDVKEVLKQAPVTVHYYKDGTTEKLAESIEEGKKDIGSKYVTEAKMIEPKVVVQDLPEKVVTTTTRYELKEVPKDKDGLVPVGGKVVTYYYVEKVDVKEVMKQAPVTVHYYKDGTTEKLAESIEQGKKDIGSKYVTEAKMIEPKVTVEETLEKTITRTVRYELKEIPKDKEGVVPVGGKVVTYYYVEKVDVREVLKQAPVTVHYYKDGTTEKLADSIEKGKQDIGSKYVTEAPRVIEEKLKDGSVRKWLLKAVPFNANGEVKAGGTTVIYYYMEFSIPKDAPVVELPEYNPSKEEPKVEVPKVQPKPMEIPKPISMEAPKEEPKVTPVVKTAEPVVQQKVLPNTGSETTNTAGLGLGVIAVGAVMVKQRRKLGKRQ